MQTMCKIRWQIIIIVSKPFNQRTRIEHLQQKLQKNMFNNKKFIFYFMILKKKWCFQIISFSYFFIILIYFMMSVLRNNYQNM